VFINDEKPPKLVVEGLFSSYVKFLETLTLSFSISYRSLSIAGDDLVQDLGGGIDELCNELRRMLNEARMQNIYTPVIQTDESWVALEEQVNIDVELTWIICLP